MPEKLEAIFPRLEGDIYQAIKNCRLLTLWPEIVDERVRNNTDPIKISNRVLYISAANPVWAQELSFLKKEIIHKFNQKAGEEAISDIRFRTTGRA